MKRYDLEADCTVIPSNGSMYSRPNGDWVRWEDVEKHCAALLRENNKLREALERILDENSEIEHPCDPPVPGYWGSIAREALRG